MPPAAIQQVPLDRVTQTIYARIHAAMKPLRDEMARVQETGELLAGAFGKFRESLPALDLSAYNAMREQLAQVTDALHEAVQVPFSTSTRTLAAQLIDHDLPRLAAIAVKLNEEDAPKFFDAFNQPDSPFEVYTHDITQKTTISKDAFDAAIDKIVNRRLVEISRLIKEDTAKWLASQGVLTDPASLEFCRRSPSQAFVYWQSLEADLACCPSDGDEKERKLRVICGTFRDWFQNQGHWRDLKPNAKDLDSTDHNAHAKHKKMIEDFVAARNDGLRVIEYDEVKSAHKCQHEGTEYEQVDYHWTYLLAGEPQVILTIETGNVMPPHNDPLKRHYFKTSAPRGYAILEAGNRLAGAVFFPNGEHVEFTPSFDARFYPEDLFRAGDYELRRVPKKESTLEAVHADVRETRDIASRLPGAIANVERDVAAVRVNTEAIAKNEYELQQENAELRELAKNGFLRFATRVEADDFRAFAAILLTGNRNQAAQALKIPQRSFYDLVESWLSRGPDYRRMSRMADWRKKTGRKIKVRLDDSLLGTEIEDQAENPETIRDVLAAMRDKTDAKNQDVLLRDILQAIASQNAHNWPHIQSEVIGLLKEELSQ